MRLIRLLGAISIALLVPLLGASPAAATVDGPCTASGQVSKTTYDARRAEVKIPRVGDVRWKGAIDTGGTGQRPIEGKVFIKMPPPFGRIQLAGSWNGPSSRTANSGTYHYDVPSILVGPKFTVSGHHAEHGTVVCTGSIEVQLSGSTIKNPALLASLALTVLALVNFLFILRVKAP